MFWLVAIVMIAVAILIILPPMRRHDSSTTPDNDRDIIRRQNIAAAREQLESMRADDGAPADMLTLDAQSEYETEIQSRLLEETEETAKDTPQEIRRTGGLGAVLSVFFLIVGAPLIYIFAGTPALLSAPDPVPANTPAPSMETALLGLEKHLQENPEDGEALALMGRALSSLGRYREAADYFARARSVRGDLPTLLAANIYALMQVEGAGEEADILLAQAVANHPDAGEIQFLAGLRARQLGENSLAAEHLRQAIILLTEDPDGQKLAQQTLDEIEREMSQGVR